MKKKCLITGGTGLIGSHLIQELLDKYEVYTIARNRQKIQSFCSDKVPDIIECDLTDPSFTEHLPKKMDYIIHLAQSEHFREFPEKALNVFAVNSLSCLRLLDYARKAGVEKFILASSGVVYGEGNRLRIEDDDLIIPNKNLGFYHTSKLCAELLAENYTNDLKLAILRFFFIYGPGQKKSMLIPRLVESVMEQKPIYLQGSEGIQINPVNVSDAVQGILRSIELEENHKINVAGAEVLSLKEIGEIIGSLLGKQPVFEIDDKTSPLHVVGNIDKMKQLLTPPKVSFREGIEKYIKLTYPELCLSRL